MKRHDEEHGKKYLELCARENNKTILENNW
jgi:hypothetical protein